LFTVHPVSLLPRAQYMTPSNGGLRKDVGTNQVRIRHTVGMFDQGVPSHPFFFFPNHFEHHPLKQERELRGSCSGTPIVASIMTPTSGGVRGFVWGN
jgi:hypothetical protein